MGLVQNPIEFRPGDIFTVEGLNSLIPNPKARWWAPWRPKFIPGQSMQCFKILAVNGPLTVRVWNPEFFYDAARHADFHAGQG